MCVQTQACVCYLGDVRHQVSEGDVQVHQPIQLFRQRCQQPLEHLAAHQHTAHTHVLQGVT